MMIGIEDVEAAARRIAGNVRRTPMIAASNLKTPVTEGVELMLKLELLQVTGSFKARGATNRLLSMQPAELAHGIVTASGGNHGIGTARAGFMAGVPAIIFLPSNASPAKIEKLKAWGAETRIVGSAWHESNVAALAFAKETGAAYFHPFADPDVVAGQGTVALEILEQMPDVDTVLVAMGGGGLISGVATALRARAPKVKVIGIEAAGAPVLLRAIEAGANIALDKVTTSVATMSCAKTDDRIFEIVRDKVDEIVLVDDDEMRAAAKWLWFEMGLAADLSGAAAIAALRERRYVPRPGERICAIVCGAGPDAIVS
ncbi:MAG TPA: threonine/serine dehydratase [Devosia sp.]|nr:threonine/serine dehydratase [Devosia sp.]